MARTCARTLIYYYYYLKSLIIFFILFFAIPGLGGSTITTFILFFKSRIFNKNSPISRLWNLTFLILFLTTFYVKEQFVNEVERVKSDVDGRRYLVRSASDSKEAANLLGTINVKLLRLIDILKEKHPDDDRTKRLDEKYDPEALSEGTEDKNYTSYSINKGEKIVFCIRSKKTGKTIPDE